MQTLINKTNLLDIIAAYIPEHAVIVEAGAFDGNDTKQLSKKWPHGVIHTFEPVPAIFNLLERNTITFPNIRRHQIALSNNNGKATFYISEKPSTPGKPCQAGSLHKPKERLTWSPIRYPETIIVPTITLDDWAQQHGISHIDFLWLDLQGHELSVIKAAPQILSTVKVIYTEVNFGQAYEGQYTYSEIKQWLEQQGFTEIGRDFVDQQKWFFGNSLFVRK